VRALFRYWAAGRRHGRTGARPLRLLPWRWTRSDARPYPTAATALRGAAAALSRLQARLAEVTAEREAEITEINRWQDEATRFAKVAEKAEASAAAMREALTDLNQHVHVLSIGQIRKRIRGAISRGDNGQG
jgi:chromosome condensin MukBEF ATPase and DNA-binding subunit MukB